MKKKMRTDSLCQRWGSEWLSLSVLLVVALLPAFATGSEIESHLRADYVGKFFIIRCLCSGDDLVYDMAGHVAKGDQTPESWTVAGLEITKLDLHENTLEIRGQRVGLLYDPVTKKFQRQNRFKMRSHGSGTELAKSRILIQSVAPASENDWQNALAAVFTSEENAADLEGLPRVWRIYLRRQRLQSVQDQQPRTDESSTSAGSTSDDDDYTVLRYKERPLRIGGRVTAPKPVSTPPPAYSEAAQASKVSGTVILWMIVDAAGCREASGSQNPWDLGWTKKRWRRWSGGSSSLPSAMGSPSRCR